MDKYLDPNYLQHTVQDFYTLACNGEVNNVISLLTEMKLESPELVTQILNFSHHNGYTILHATTCEILDRLWEYNPPKLVFKPLFELIKLGANRDSCTFSGLTIKRILNGVDWSVWEEYEFQYQEFFLGEISFGGI